MCPCWLLTAPFYKVIPLPLYAVAADDARFFSYAYEYSTAMCPLHHRLVLMYEEKRDRQYFGYNFDKFKYIVVTFYKEYHECNAKLLTQQKSASPNRCRYFTLRISQWPYKTQSHNWQLQLNQTGLLACNCSTGQRQTVLEMTAAGLDVCTLRDDDATDAQKPQWQREPA